MQINDLLKLRKKIFFYIFFSIFFTQCIYVTVSWEYFYKETIFNRRET